MKNAIRGFAVLAFCMLLAGCGSGGGKIKIGLSMDTLRAARWIQDRDVFVERCAEMGVKVLVQSAESNDALQNSQAENLLTQGIQCLVVIAHNAKSCASIVEAAHKAGVPVLAYDRLILDSDVDAYVSFDNIRVGEMQAGELVKLRPEGNYVLMGGAPTDYNAKLLRIGQMNVLSPLVKKGDIKIVGDQWSNDWLAVNALKNMENILTRTGNRVDAVVDSYDGTAGGCVQALAVALAKKETLPAPTTRTNNGKKDVPSCLLDLIPVNKNNLVETVIADGFQKMEEVYRGVPKDQWPKPAVKK